MKKIYSIFSVLLLLSVVSCSREKMTAIEEPAKEPTVPVILSLSNPVVLQAGTKAELGMEMGVKPAISNIHVAIFGRDRYLKDYVSAFPCDKFGEPVSGFVTENSDTAYFLARLPISSSERVLHVIANGPSTLPFNAYENDIMQNLRVSDGNGAYWQRITLTGGITVEEELNEHGQVVYKQDGNGEYIPKEETKAALKGIALIRNFASIAVSSSASNFQLVSYTLCNMPSSGSIAMYSTNHGDWVPGYKSIDRLENHLVKYEDEDDNNTVKTYLGFPVNPELNTSIPTTVDAYNAPGVTYGPGEPVYVYERAVTDDNPPFILMAARYVASGTPTSSTPIQYYRLDLALENGYIPIYRNFQYTIDISGVAVAGYDDPGMASQHNSGSNFSVSLDTRTLPDVSNGVVRLNVEQPNFDWVYNSDSQQFYYKFFLNDGGTVLNGDVEVTEMEGGNALASYSKATSDTGDKRYVNYTLNQPNGTSTLSSTLQLVGTYTSGTDVFRLVRMVTIRVFNAKQIQPTLTPSTVADQEGQLTTLGIPLPWDLQASMFPMEILIEDSAKALNPMDYEIMPVKTTDIDDPSVVFKSLTDNTTPSYCFVRTLNWSDYQRLKNDAELSGSDYIILNCDFETTKVFETTTVYVYNKYFATDASGITTAQATLMGDKYNNITPNRQNISGTSAVVTVKSTGNWTLSISLANGNVAAGASLSATGGASTNGTDVTVTLPENVTENAIRYLLTLTNTSESPAITRTAYITQAGILMTLSSTTASVENGGDTGDIGVTVSVESGVPYILEVLDSRGNVLSTSSEYPATSGTPASRTVTIPVNNTVQSRVFTVRARNTIGTIWHDIYITQAAGVANLSIVDSEIRRSETSATVHLQTSFPTVLKWYNTSGNVLVNTMNVEKGERDVEVTVGANNTSSDRTFRVDLCDTDGNVLRTGTFTQLGDPYLALTTSNSEIGNTTKSATLNVESEAAWTVSVSGGLSGASLSPASGSATPGTEVTLSVPVNNTLSAQTYTVTAENGAFTKTATVTQAAGTASLSVVDTNIWMTATSATVNVASTFPSVLKVYVPGNDVPVVTKNLENTAAHNETITGLPVNGTGTDRTLRVDLCNTEGAVVATGNITQAGTPVLTLTGGGSIAGNITSANLSLVSEENWTLSVTKDGTPIGTSVLSADSGTGSLSSQPIVLTMPVNYTTSPVVYRVTASNGTDTQSVEVTQRAATEHTGATRTFNTGNGNGDDFNTSGNTSASKNGLTASFTGINQYPASGWTNRDYLTLNDNSTLSISITDQTQVYRITGVTMTFSTRTGIFTYTYYDPDSITAVIDGSTAASATEGSNYYIFDWTGSVDYGSQLTLTFIKSGGGIRMESFTVTYTYYTWS